MLILMLKLKDFKLQKLIVTKIVIIYLQLKYQMDILHTNDIISIIFQVAVHVGNLEIHLENTLASTN